MLSIKRKPGESFWVGDVQVCVHKVVCGVVQFGIQGPRSVRVDRDEVRQRMLAEAASGAGVGSQTEGISDVE